MATSLQRDSWTFYRVLERTGEVLHKEGVRSLWFKMLGETVYRRMVLLEYPLQEPLPVVTAGLPMEMGLLEKTQIAEYLEFNPEAYRSGVQRKFDAGHWCFVARHEGRLVAASWAAANRMWINYLSCEIRLAPDEVYGYDSLTAPAFRGQNLITALTVEKLRYFRAAGYRRLVAVVSPENRAALRSSVKTDWRVYGMMGYVKIGPWRRNFCRVRDVSTPIEERARS